MKCLICRDSFQAKIRLVLALFLRLRQMQRELANDRAQSNRVQQRSYHAAETRESVKLRLCFQRATRWVICRL